MTNAEAELEMEVTIRLQSFGKSRETRQSIGNGAECDRGFVEK